MLNKVKSAETPCEIRQGSSRDKRTFSAVPRGERSELFRGKGVGGKKTLIIIGVVVLVLVIGFFVFVKISDYLGLGKKQGTTFDKSKEQLGFSRNYPEVIKGNWEPSPNYMDKLMKNEIEDLKNLGVNTVSVVAEYKLKADGSYKLDVGPFGSEKTIKNNLELAKENGFAVLLSPNFVGGTLPDYIKKETDVDLEKYKQISREIALYWAEIAEAYQVEYFAPQNEFDLIMEMNFTDNKQEKVQLASDWHKEILPEIKEKFKGKTMAKMANSSENYNVSGYDYLGTTISHGAQSLEQFKTDLKKDYDNLSQAAKNSNCQWLVSEAWMPYDEKFSQAGPGSANINLDEMQDDYFKILTDEYLNFSGTPKPQGFIFIAWLMEGMEIKDRPAEAVIKNFFSKLN